MAVAVAAFARPAAAQVAPAPDARFEDLRPAILASIAPSRDRVDYRFDNFSSFDTAETVPHFFEQHYDADNVWIAVTARYPANARWETSAGLTPTRATTADDYDTFFNPDGTVWVSGTTGPATLQSFQFEQRLRLRTAGGLGLSGGYRWHLDRADFGTGHKTVTRNGVLVEALDVTTPEFTSAQLHEVFFGASLARRASPRWIVRVSGEAAPSSVGRLLIQLPDKYPGRDLVYVAAAVSASGRATIARTGRVPIEIAVGAGRVWSYRTTAAVRRSSVSVTASLGFAR